MAIKNMVTDDKGLRERCGRPRVGYVVNGTDANENMGEVEVERVVVWNTGQPDSLPNWDIYTYRCPGHYVGQPYVPEYFEGVTDLDNVCIQAMGVRRVYWRKAEALKDARTYVRDALEAWQENLVKLS